MRDRMILFRDQFDLDDCFNCILGGSVFHGGDPAIAGNWQLPAEFFEKYWFLTIDYDIRRYTNEWRKKQGLKEIKSNILSIHQEEKPITKEPSPPLHVNNPPPPPSSIPTLSHEDLSGYLGVQLNKHQPPQPQPQQITPIQLTNGFGIMGSSGAAVNSHSDLQHPSPWQNLMGSKDYGM
jgi:hypothetical protein